MQWEIDKERNMIGVKHLSITLHTYYSRCRYTYLFLL